MSVPGAAVHDPFVWRIVSPAEPQTPVLRYGHTAIEFDGCMYVFGGFNPEVGTLADLWVFHFDSNVWTQLEPGGDLPAPRFYHSAVRCGRAMYVFGGHSGHGGTYYDDVLKFDFDECEWVPVQVSGLVPAGRRSHTAVVWPPAGQTVGDGGVEPERAMYVFGGFCGTHHSSQIHRLSLVTFEWSRVETVAETVPPVLQLSPAVSPRAVSAVESPVLRTRPAGQQPTRHRRRPSGADVMGADGAPQALKGHTAVVHEGLMYVFGGQTGALSASSILFQYQFATRTWRVLEFDGEPPELRSGHVAVTHYGDMYVFGGKHGERGVVWRVALRPQANGRFEWRRIECRGIQPRARSFASAVVCNDRIVVFGGYANDSIKKRKHFRNDLLELALEPIVVPPPSLDSDLRAFLNCPELADVTFRVGASRVAVPAHKLILCARSETFRLMFRNPMRESLESVVELPEVEPTVFAPLLEFMYTDHVQLRGQFELAAQLIPLAEQYALPRLKALCIDTLRTAISVPNVVFLLMLADLYHSDGLKRLCLDFMVAHLPVVRQQPSFAELKHNPELLFEVMQRFGVAARTRS
ncbi:uncharacterized protein AMSG_04224 [Thecamonas trahens ATCC 50062]|uniref:BTB domain-containing protein n=1 Tax=Thecamonas trahens ATCC 50062 TaxID=461836 RepID=A0A0L0D6L3_THETB|nr:hypothetical protein AMSG_04224 [Thecamonas trahens ATCC 50062]KNC47989.1 hypothetical protein AMSG_04224 [Thecamonas trahens ATCC 50062]|eukprot:XP_013759006.1 hypothetical protein AMSG_04224 [Thecamonas trahens ATCC 50062]